MASALPYLKESIQRRPESFVFHPYFRTTYLAFPVQLFLYQKRSAEFNPKLCTIVLCSCFSEFIGYMSVIGLKRRMLKLNTEYECRLNDGVNMTKWIKVFINSNMRPLCVYAFLHIIGNPIEHDWLQCQLSLHPVIEQATEVIWINSKFDYNCTYKVMSFNEVGVHGICI